MVLVSTRLPRHSKIRSKPIGLRAYRTKNAHRTLLIRLFSNNNNHAYPMQKHPNALAVQAAKSLHHKKKAAGQRNHVKADLDKLIALTKANASKVKEL